MDKIFQYENKSVAIIYNDNESEAVLEGLKRIHLEREITSEDVVVLTPNWVNKEKSDPAAGVVVGPETMRTIIGWIKEKHPKRIVVATGSGGGDTEQVMKEVGFDKIIQEEQVEFVDFNRGPYVEIQLNHEKPKTTKLNKIYEEMTYYISFTQLKIHEEATMSASIKNFAIGWPSTEEHGAPKKNLGIHDNLHGFIAAMAERIKVDLAIVSANPVMVGTGPTKGIAMHTGLVICGSNPISVDSICARLLGFISQGVGYLQLLENRGYKETDISKITMEGIPLVKAQEIFTKAVYGVEVSYDKDKS